MGKSSDVVENEVCDFDVRLLVQFDISTCMFHFTYTSIYGKTEHKEISLKDLGTFVASDFLSYRDRVCSSSSSPLSDYFDLVYDKII